MGTDGAGARLPEERLHFTAVYSEKRENHGEDAQPIAESFGPAAFAVAVCDGLGGAGAAQIRTEEGQFSAAYLASRLAINTMQGVLADWLTDGVPQPVAEHAPDRSPGERLRDRLTERLRGRFADYQERTGARSGGIRGDLIRPLPTTLALGVARAEGAGRVELYTLWAGDSRVYLLRPDTGLQQVTADDLKSAGDAMRNLHEDSPMSNLVSADGRFHLNLSALPLDRPTVVIAATDGCFGYLLSPTHFEGLLLDAMEAANRRRALSGSDGWAEWAEEIRARIVPVTGDDATLGAAGLGWSDFGVMAGDFADRRARIAEVTASLDDLAAAHAASRRAMEAAKEQFEQAQAELWKSYRTGYEDLLRFVVRPAGSREAAAPSGPSHPAEPDAKGAPAGADRSAAKAGAAPGGGPDDLTAVGEAVGSVTPGKDRSWSRRKS